MPRFGEAVKAVKELPDQIKRIGTVAISALILSIVAVVVAIFKGGK